MGFSINKAIIVGTIGNDAEHRLTNNNTSVTTFNVATEHSLKQGDGGYKNITTWHRVTFFGLGDFHKQQLNKGMKVYVEGRINKNEYTDKEGIKRTSVDIIGDSRGLIVFPKNNGSTSGSAKKGNPNEEVDPNFEDNDDLPF